MNLKYYNNISKTLSLPSDFNEEFGYDCKYSEFNQEIKENVLPKSIKNICLWSHYNLINNLPLWIDEVYIVFSHMNKDNKEVNNLPMTLKKIIIVNDKYLKYITKIPFGCEIVIKHLNEWFVHT